LEKHPARHALLCNASCQTWRIEARCPGASSNFSESEMRGGGIIEVKGGTKGVHINSGDTNRIFSYVDLREMGRGCK